MTMQNESEDIVSECQRVSCKHMLRGGVVEDKDKGNAHRMTDCDGPRSTAMSPSVTQSTALSFCSLLHRSAPLDSACNTQEAKLSDVLTHRGSEGAMTQIKAIRQKPAVLCPSLQVIASRRLRVESYETLIFMTGAGHCRSEKHLAGNV